MTSPRGGAVGTRLKGARGAAPCGEPPELESLCPQHRGFGQAAVKFAAPYGNRSQI